MFKKKRRPAKSVNKNEQKILRERAARAGGLLKEVYPAAQTVTVELAFFTPQLQPFDRQTRVYRASDVCDFTVPCPGRCGQGAFDVAGKLKSMIESRQAFSESSAVCRESLFDGSNEPCGLELRCKIKAVYN